MKKNYNKLLLLLCAVATGLQVYATQITVQVSNFQFSPANVNAFVGDTMHFVWVSGSHTTTCDGSALTVLPAGAPSWDSPMNSSVTTFDYTITVAGNYTYKCIPHAGGGMIGTINATLPPNPLVNITFRVDLSQQTICAGGPHIAGSFNGWSTTATSLTSVGAGVYEATIALDSTQTYQYKFLKDNAFSTCGDETVPGACNVGGNREITVPESDSTLASVCFNSCAACIPPGYADITFTVDMSQTTLGASGPHLAGSFNGFSATATPMTNIGAGIYQATVNIDTSYTVQYTFLKDSSYTGQEAVPAACGVSNGFGGYNRQLDVPENDSTLATVCYGSCSLCPPLVAVTFKVDMSQTTLGPGGPHVAGSFNGFSATANQLSLVSGIYRKKIFIPAGTTIQYVFLKDSTYTGQENVPASCGVNNGFGGYNREITVPFADTSLDVVCYSSCGACVVPGYANITFNVDMTNEIIAPGGVHLAGSFNGFSATATPMIDIGSNVYQATVNIDTSFTVQYTFLKDSSYTNQEIVPASCGVNNGFGGYNRQLVMPENDSTLATVCYSGCSSCVTPGYANVTFRVDMSQTTVCPGGPYIVGSFNGFSATATPMINVGAGVYEAVITLDTTQTIQYKFLKDSTYSCGDESVPAACGVPNGFGGYNREVSVPENDTTLATVCFGTCSACIVPGYADITFSVDMTNETIAGGGVHLTGSFNGFSTTATPMTDIGSNIYQATVTIDTSFVVQYLFLKDTTFTGQENVPAACGVNNGFGGYNRELIVPENNSTLPTVCYSSCFACVPLNQKNVTFRVDISQETPCPGGPYLVGSFNGFSATATPMTPIGAGVYEVTLSLDTTVAYQYKFLKDSTYSCGDESVPALCGVPNGFGGFNREVTVPLSDTVLSTVCFSSCSACVAQNQVNVTFRVDVSQETACPGGPHLVGSFNGFSATATPMTSVGAGVYEATLLLDTGSIIQYKFLKDSTYSCGDESVPSACGVPNGFGGFNRSMTIGNGDSTLVTVCFSSCSACIPANQVNVTFRVDMSQTTLGPGGPHIAGTFNGFNAAATPLTSAGSGIYSYTIALDTTLNIQYTFLKDSTYNGQEVISSACGVSNGFGGFNRFIDVPESDTILPAFCYSSCSVCVIGVNQLHGDEVISVYPNPTENIINIETAAIHDNFELELYSMDGKLLFERKVSSGYQQIIAIDMQGFAKGVYTLKIESTNSASYQKVILK